MKKRLLSMILAISMVLTFLPVGAVTAFADGTLLDDLAFDATGAPVNKTDPNKTEGNGWKKWESTVYPYNDVLLLNGSSTDSYYISGVNYPIVVMNDAEAPGTSGSIDGNFSNSVDVVGGTIKDGFYSGDVAIFLGSTIQNGTFEKLVYLENSEFYTAKTSDYNYTTGYNNIYGGLFEKGVTSHAYSGRGAAYVYSPRIYGGTFCCADDTLYGNPDFVGANSGAYPEIYGGVFETINASRISDGAIKASTHYTLTTQEDCTINDIITSGSAVIVPNADAASKDAYPTKVTLHYTGNDAVLDWCVVYPIEGADISEDTTSLTVWPGATNVTGANTSTVTFTAKPNSTNVRVYPVLAAKKIVQLPTNIPGIKAKVSYGDSGYSDVEIPTNGTLSVRKGASVIITAPALTDATKKYQWTNGDFKIPEDSRNLFDDGCSYLTVAADDVTTIGLEIVDKTPEIPAGDTRSTTLTNAVLKKVINDGTDITAAIIKNADGSYNIPIGAAVTVAFDREAFADSGSKFSYWKITGLTQDEANKYNKQESFTFTMPENAVTLEAMTQDESIDDTTAEILGTAAIIGTAVVGTAVLAYQGHQLGTQLYLTYLLPSGAVIPVNRIQLAMLLWQDAGNPVPVDEPAYSDLDADDTDTLQAAQWAVETGLMELPDPDNAPDQFDPYAAVSTVEVIHAWKNAQKMKG